MRGWSRPLTSRALADSGTSGRSIAQRRTGSPGPLQDLAQLLAGGDQVVAGACIGRDIGSRVEDRRRDAVGHRDLAVEQIAVVALGPVGQRPQRSLRQQAEMPGQHHVRIGGVEAITVHQLGGQLAKLLFEPGSDQPLIGPG